MQQVLELVKFESNDEAEAPRIFFSLANLLISSEHCKHSFKVDMMAKLLQLVWETEEFSKKGEGGSQKAAEEGQMLRGIRQALINNLMWQESDWETPYKLATKFKDVQVLKLLRHFAEINKMFSKQILIDY